MTKDNVIEFLGYTTQDLNPNKVLSVLSAEDDIEHFSAVVLRKNGEITYHSSTADIMKINYWLDKFKKAIMENFGYDE